MEEQNQAATFLPRAERQHYDGSELLPGLSGRTVMDYWRWAHSDILENVQRGIFAEYLVAEALGVASAHRVGWTGYDLDYDGYKIEVKSSAYLQSWQQRRHSKISFSIGARRQLNEDQVTYEETGATSRIATSSPYSLTVTDLPPTFWMPDAGSFS